MPNLVRAAGSAVAGLCVVLAVAVPAFADGIRSVPARIDIENGFRGAEYSRSIALQNDFEEAGEFVVTTEGEIGEWISVTDLDGNAVETIAAPPGVELELIAVVAVPADAANGGYDGSINAQLVLPSDPDAVDVRFGTVMPVAIEIVGEEIISGSFLDLLSNDGEVGLLHRLTAVVQNSGNVAQRPVIAFEVTDDTGDVVHSDEPLVDFVAPGETRSIQLDWDTSEERPGTYTAVVSVSFGDVELGTREAVFDLAPRGTLSRSGVFRSLVLGGDTPAPGGVARVIAEFENTGQIESRVELVGELFRNGALVAAVNTPPTLVLAGDTKTIEAFIDIADEGSYALIARVNYEGEVTDALTLEFTVEPVGSEGGGTGGLVAAVVAALVAAGAGLFVFLRRRAANRPSLPVDESRERLRHVGGDTEA